MIYERESAGAGDRPNRSMVLKALDWIYDLARTGQFGMASSDALAGKYKRRWHDPEEAIRRLIRSETLWAGAVGFINGFPGVITIPIAVPVNLVSVLYIQLRMVQAIAIIRGYEPNDEEVRAFLLACLVGSGVADSLKEAGIQFTTRAARLGIQRKISAETMKHINCLIAQRCVTKAGQTGVMNLGKLLPSLGGFLSGGFDAATTGAVAAAAKKFFARIETAPAY